MSQAAAKKRVQRGEAILPEEQFWKCYSPQNEFPLSFVCSLAVHGLVLGLLVLIAARFWWYNAEANEPPRMDAVEVQGDLEGGGGTGGAGGPGVGVTVPGPLAKLENSALKDLLKSKEPVDKGLDVPAKPDSALQVKETVNKPDESDAVFGAILADVQEEVAKTMNVPVEQVKSVGLIGGSPGTGGGIGGGEGGGIGKKKGQGTGSDPNGKLLSQVQKRQLRWRIKFSENPKEHIQQLKALHVTLAIPGTLPDFYSLLDLSSPALKFSQTIGLKQHANKFKFFNVYPQGVAMLAQELRLPTTPKYLVIFLPESMENELAQLEAEHAKGVPEDQIQYTLFQITQRPDGSYGPIVIEQKLKGGAQGP